MTVVTYQDVRRYLTRHLDANPDNKMDVPTLAREIAKWHRRQGMSGPGDTVMVTLAEVIEKWAVDEPSE